MSKRESIRTILSQHQQCLLDTDEAAKCILDIFENENSTELNLKLNNQHVENIGNEVAKNINQEMVDALISTLDAIHCLIECWGHLDENDKVLCDAQGQKIYEALKKAGVDYE